MEHKNRIITVAIITGVVALLLGCCLGAMFGALGGYLIGHQTSRPVERFMLQTPDAPELPEMPALPSPLARQGAVIQEVIAGSPAEEAGIEVGDIITEVNGMPIDPNHRLADVVSQYQPGDRVKIMVWRAGDTERITATLGANPSDETRPYLGVRYADFAEQPDDAEPND